jgi:beta-1,4-mannosyltransferase
MTRNTRAAPERPGRLRVLFVPDFSSSNPYQRLLADALADEGVDVVRFPAPGRDPLPLVRAWLQRGRPPVVHLHWTHVYLGGAGAPGTIERARFDWQLRTLKRLGVRLVWTIHNLGAHDSALGSAERTVHRDLFLRADAVIAHCAAAADAAAQCYGLSAVERARISVIPHGNYIDVYPGDVQRAEARARLGVLSGVRLLAFVGAIRPYKGLEALIASFRAIPNPAAQLLICGDPRPASEGEALVIAAAGDPRIRIDLRFVPADELPVILAAADAVVLPFRDVLTSGSAVLAMSHGRALVAPRMGCLPELIPDAGGLLYDADAPGGLRAALEIALTSDLSEIGRRNFARARELAWGPIAAATARLYRG